MRFKLAATLLALVLPLLVLLCDSATSPCQNAWKFPANCQGNCTYQLVWRFRPQDDTIEFIVSSRHASRWTGVGFAQDKTLKNSDAIFAWIEENSRYVMMDAFLPTYANPISDKVQSISNISATVSNGLISFRFIRKRNTLDPGEDLIFGDERCLYLIYPVEGGSVDLKNRAVVTDEYAPQISERPVCIRACNYTSPTRPPALGPTARPLLAGSSSQRPSSTSSTTSTSTSTTSTTTSTTTTTTTTTTPRPTTTTSTTTSTTSPRPTTTSTTTSAPSPSPPPTTTTSSTTSSTTSTTTSPPSAPTTQAPASENQQWCAGRWSHPPACRFQGPSAPDALAYLQQPIDGSLKIQPLPLDQSDCSYLAQWQYLEASDSIEFIIQTKTRNKWTGIGFGNTTRMANSDAIIGLIEETSGRHFVMDTWLRDHVMPEIDANQSTESTWGKRENMVTTLRFRRKRLTGDQFDFQFTDDSCAYFFFPTQGGTFNAISKRMHKHEAVPSVSRQRICVRSCTRPGLDQPTSQPDLGEPGPASATSQSPNLFLLSASPPTSPSSSSTAAPTTVGPPEKNPDTTSSVGLAPSNDLNVELDSASTSSTSASSGHNSNPFNRLAFLSEPSLRWLAGIGCVATLLAMIVFQACFTVYKNKQACKQNLYRQSAFKQNAYLHGAYLADHQASAAVQESQAAANLQAAAAAKLADVVAQSVPVRPRPQAQRPKQARPLVPPSHPFAAQQRAAYADFATPSATESSEQEEEEEEEDELDEVEEDEEFEDDMIMDDSFDYNHRLAYHNHRHPFHAVPPAHQPSYGAHHAHHHHHHHQPAPQHHQHRAQSHYRQAGHYHAPSNQQVPANLHRAHLPTRSQPHQTGGHPANQSRPDAYFLPSQRRY